jgi:hypothetical protein
MIGPLRHFIIMASVIHCSIEIADHWIIVEMAQFSVDQ